MTKATFKTRYEPDRATAGATVSVNAGDLKLRASMTDATIAYGPSLNGLTLAVEKPGFFIIDYNVPKKDIRFQFMNTVKVGDKRLSLTYIHSKGDHRTILNGSLAIDSANKVSANHVVGAGNTKLKYTYSHGGLTTLEPSYDLGKNAFDFSVSRKVPNAARPDVNDLFRATYQTSNNDLDFEWLRSSTHHGTFKVIASLNLSNERKMTKLCAETTWDYVM